jgi:hypothetical protein
MFSQPRALPGLEEPPPLWGETGYRICKNPTEESPRIARAHLERRQAFFHAEEGPAGGDAGALAKLA